MANLIAIGLLAVAFLYGTVCLYYKFTVLWVVTWFAIILFVFWRIACKMDKQEEESR